MRRPPKTPNLRGSQSRNQASEETLQQLVERCYNAALEPALWSDFLAEYSAAVGASSANMHSRDMSRGALHYLNDHNLPKDALQSYAAYYHDHDIWIPPAAKLAAGTIICSEVLVSREVFLASEFYNDFLRPQGICHINSIEVANERRELAFVNLFRPENQEDFGDAEREIAAKLFPHLRRATRISEQLRHLETERECYRDSLERLPQPVFLIGEDGSVFFKNQAASALVSEADGVDLRQGRLVATQVPAAQALADLIAGALAWFDKPLVAAGGIVQVRRPSGRPGIVLYVTPLGTGLADGFRQRRCVAVYAGAPECGPASLTERLAAIYDLTPAEARLAEGLVHGTRLNDLADLLGISKNTARFQLKAIFLKTDAHSQSELIRRVLLTFGPLPDGPDCL